jgi:hypothetical protein
MARRIDEYYPGAAARVKSELLWIMFQLHKAQKQMTPKEFTGYLWRRGMAEADAEDFLASDGSIERMTDRMWIYFESPLKPHKVLSA